MPSKSDAPPAPQFPLYAFLSRWSWPASYTGKLLFVAFIGTHVPLLAALFYVALSTMTLAAAWPILATTLAATLAGAILTMAALRSLLQPILCTSDALRHYVAEHELPHLPTRYHDEVGQLMADTQGTLTHLNQLIGFKNRMLHVVSHDLHSPASSILMANDILRSQLNRKQPDPDVVREMTGLIKASVRRQFELTDSLTTYTHEEDAGAAS